jgi:hypothetical protein
VGVDDLVAILIFLLSLILLIAGAVSGYESIDLLPTATGVLYALAGAVAACAAVVTFAVAVLTWRVDALAKLVRESAAPSGLPAAFEATPTTERAPAEHGSAAPMVIETAAPERMDEAPETMDIAPAGEDESPINLNRSGHLPSLETPEEPQGPPSLIGSYSSAGANYRIFADGSIEAETSEGTYKFASMSDFKRHLLERGKAKTTPASE